jgi:hypothetical protein
MSVEVPKGVIKAEPGRLQSGWVHPTGMVWRGCNRTAGRGRIHVHVVVTGFGGR